MSKRFMLGTASVVLVAVLGMSATHVGAKKANAPGADNVFLLRTNLSLVGGENPTGVTNVGSVAHSIATWTGTQVIVTIEEMDATRFPATIRTSTGTISPCTASFAVGPTIRGTAPVVPKPKANGQTQAIFVNPGPAAVGDAVTVDVVCAPWTDRNGLSQPAHETHWAGAF